MSAGLNKTARNPFPTVDIIIELNDFAPGAIVLVRRRNPPYGWALPGGFIDYGESAEAAARREALEETGLQIRLLALLGVYSRPDRDPRQHTMSSVFIAQAFGLPKGGDDAEKAQAFAWSELPAKLCFDHSLMLEHYRQWRQGLRPAAAIQSD